MEDTSPNLPSNKAPQPDPNEELVKIFDSDQESEVWVVHGLLESAGIESQVTSLDAEQNLFPGVGGMIIRVRAEQADEARQVIDSYRSDETAEIEVIEEPPAQ
jgi:hypothetical protein